MPIYEYLCTKCGSRFEKLQKSGAPGEIECPTCGSMEVTKEFSTFSSAGISSSEAGCFSGG